MTGPERYSDEALEREIEALLSVDHSPEFRARVRASLPGLPAPAPRGFGWRLLPVGAGLCAAAVLALLWPAGEPAVPTAAVVVRAPEVPAVPDGPATPIPGPPAIEAARMMTAAPARVGRSGATPTTDSDAPPFPEVLISAEETQALRLLLTSVRSGRVLELPETDPAGAGRLLVLDDVKVETLVIEPLALMAQAEGERR